MMVKSPNDGCWYYETTQWKFILECLCDALGFFSEEDKVSQMYIVLDKFADDVSEIVKKQNL